MPDVHYLSAALGWLGLGNWREANEELERISPPSQTHPDVLKVRWEICARAETWDKAVEISKALQAAEPLDPQLWIQYAYATRRAPGGGITLAKEILTLAQKLFQNEPIIVYNLACYECQLGDLKRARKWLEKAFAAGDAKKLRQMAAADPDLKPLWKDMNEI
jgi:Flp pilus assembly protein TadD